MHLKRPKEVAFSFSFFKHCTVNLQAFEHHSKPFQGKKKNQSETNDSKLEDS